MYKTVKRVMTVMIIGLVAMLGAKAEAHYIVVRGKIKYCSVCINAMLMEHEDLPVNLATHTEEVEFCVKTESVDILCPPGGAKVKSPIQEDVPVVRKLVVRKPIVPGDNTTEDVGFGISTAEVEGVISDTSLLLVETPKFCRGLNPLDVLIRAMKVEIKTYACDISHPTKCETVSTLEAHCTLSDKFNLKHYPKNLPPIGTLYNCKE